MLLDQHVANHAINLILNFFNCLGHVLRRLILLDLIAVTTGDVIRACSRLIISVNFLHIDHLIILIGLLLVLIDVLLLLLLVIHFKRS